MCLEEMQGPALTGYYDCPEIMAVSASVVHVCFWFFQLIKLKLAQCFLEMSSCLPNDRDPTSRQLFLRLRGSCF